MEIDTQLPNDELPEPTQRWWAKWLLIVVSVLPFQVIFLGPVIRDDAAATGFILYDMPYYVANGREVFERGNGLMYPNPYDCSEDAPTIYFHWLLWIFGFCTVKLGMDPGVLFAGTGFAGSLLLAWMTWKLVHSILPDIRWQKTLFLLTMWGGGVLCAAKVLMNLFEGQSLWHDILVFDTHSGFWFFSWGRNSIYATEAVYHFLAIAAWYCAYHRRYWKSVVLAGLLAATHPWSGLEVLGTFAAFLGFRALMKNTQPAWRMAVTTLLMLCAFFAYNLWYLNLHEAHRALYEIWHINWSLGPVTIFLAYVPIGYFALRAISDHVGSSETVDQSSKAVVLPTEWQAFLMVAFLCAFALATHDRFVAHAKQPLHFTRGFLWMPLCLLALPYIQKLMIRRPSWNARPILAATLLLSLACFDNVAFLSRTGLAFWKGECDVQIMQPSEREVFDWIESNKLTGVLACSDHLMSYLSATYTAMNPYAGHQFNTPDFKSRIEQLNAWFLGGDDPQLEKQIDYVLLKHSQVATANLGAAWSKVYENEELILLQKSKQLASF